jgi:hypothetical protein
MIVATVAILLSSCRVSDEALRVDLERYLRRANDWAPVEAETARAIDRILQTQFVDEAEVRRQIAADRPRAKAHLDAVAAIASATPELRAIHDRYVQVWRSLLGGYDDVSTGIDAADASRLSRGRAALEAWRLGIIETATDLRRLRSQLGT